MKKAVFYVLALVMLSSLVFAAEGPPEGAGAAVDGGNAPEDTGNGTGGEAPMLTTATQNAGEEQQLAVQTREQAEAGAGSENAEQVRARVEEKVQTKQQELEQEMVGKSEKEQNVLQNQNQVRLAVHALLEMKDEIGGIGPQVSEIAQQFDNSVQATIKAEERIQAKSGFARFFSGGDEKAAEELETEVNANKAKVEELKQLKEQCECSEETKALMQEQIQSMEQEQERLGELAQKEKKSKGMFGWLWK